MRTDVSKCRVRFTARSKTQSPQEPSPTMANSFIATRSLQRRQTTDSPSTSVPSPCDTTTSWFWRSLPYSRCKTRLRRRDDAGLLRECRYHERYDDVIRILVASQDASHLG